MTFIPNSNTYFFLSDIYSKKEQCLLKHAKHPSNMQGIPKK